MNGVEILTSEEVAIAYNIFNWSNFGLVAYFALIFAIFAGLIYTIKEYDFLSGVIAFASFFVIGAFGFGIPIGATTAEPTEYETQYKVTIDDSVSMTEFINKYEIIDQDGKIYTVRERE